MDKSTLINLSYIILLVIALVIYYYKQHVKEKKASSAKPTRLNLDGASFLAKLNQLGYFKYTAPQQLEALKMEMQNAYEHHGELATIEEKDIPVCHRLFSADAEYIFEEGGFIQMLRELTQAFEVRNLAFDIGEHVESYDENVANQWVIVNQRKYVIYDNLKGTTAGWEVATNNLTYLLNQELEKQHSEERVYTILGGNDAMILFLTREQYQYLDKVNLQDEFKPRMANKDGF